MYFSMPFGMYFGICTLGTSKDAFKFFSLEMWFVKHVASHTFSYMYIMVVLVKMVLKHGIGMENNGRFKNMILHELGLGTQFI